MNDDNYEVDEREFFTDYIALLHSTRAIHYLYHIGNPNSRVN